MTKAAAPAARVVLPQIVAGRQLADRIVDRWSNLHERDVVVDAYQLVSVNEGFVDQLVVRVLVDSGARSLTIVSAPPSFEEAFERSITRHDVEHRGHLTREESSLR